MHKLVKYLIGVGIFALCSSARAQEYDDPSLPYDQALALADARLHEDLKDVDEHEASIQTATNNRDAYYTRIESTSKQIDSKTQQIANEQQQLNNWNSKIADVGTYQDNYEKRLADAQERVDSTKQRLDETEQQIDTLTNDVDQATARAEDADSEFWQNYYFDPGTTDYESSDAAFLWDVVHSLEAELRDLEGSAAALETALAQAQDDLSSIERDEMSITDEMIDEYARQADAAQGRITDLTNEVASLDSLNDSVLAAIRGLDAQIEVEGQFEQTLLADARRVEAWFNSHNG